MTGRFIDTPHGVEYDPTPDAPRVEPVEWEQEFYPQYDDPQPVFRPRRTRQQILRESLRGES